MEPTPLHLPYFPTETIGKLSEVLLNEIQQGDGLESQSAVDFIKSKYVGTEVLMVPSCTAAIELSLLVLNVGPGDEVILPSYNFSSAAAAITKLWATPVFCDVNPVTGCLDVGQLQFLISEKTKAITWVNYGGIGVDTASLKKISLKYGIPLIEDAAHNFGVFTEGDSGPTGDFVTFSFHATKNLQCGEGGALVITNSKFWDRAHIAREKGTNRKAFNDRIVSKYRWIGRGGSYLLSEISCAILVEQLKHFDQIQSKRTEIVDQYFFEISSFLPENWSILQGTRKSAHMFALLAPEASLRDQGLMIFNSLGVGAASHYEDLATSPAGQGYGKVPNACINSIRFAARIIRLPVFFSMSERQINNVISATQYLFTRKLL